MCPNSDSEDAGVLAKIPNPFVGALWAGCLTTRLYFHLQQAWMLGGSYDRPADRERIEQQCGSHCQNGVRAFNALGRVTVALQLSDLERVRQGLHDFRYQWTNEYGPEHCLAAVDAANEEFQRCPVEGAHENLCRGLVKPHVERFYFGVLNLFESELRDTSRSAFELGLCLEEGRCRTDVYRLLHRSWAWWELREDDGLPDSLDDWDAGCKRDPDDEPRDLLATFGWEPGELAPEESWLHELPEYWKQSGLSAVLPETFDEFRAAYVRQQVSRDSLGNLLTELHRVAIDGYCQIWDSRPPDGWFGPIVTSFRRLNQAIGLNPRRGLAEMRIRSKKNPNGTIWMRPEDVGKKRHEFHFKEKNDYRLVMDELEMQTENEQSKN